MCSIAQKMTVKDSDTHILMEVNDEGLTGSISLPAGAEPDDTSAKLYNMGDKLYWNGSELGTAGSAGGWTDSGTDVCLATESDMVGIGTGSPQAKLNVGFSSAGYIRLDYGTGGCSGLDLWENNARIALLVYDSAPAAEEWSFYAGGITTKKMVIENTGNIGIGTDSPDYKLDVNGTGNFAGTVTFPGGKWNASGNVGIGTTNPQSPLNIDFGTGGYVRLDYETDGFTGLDIWENDTRIAALVYDNAPSVDEWSFYAGNITTKRMVIENSGNVGIGTSNPGSTLDVNGTTEMTGFKMPTGATTTYVLTSDASGVAPGKPLLKEAVAIIPTVAKSAARIEYWGIQTVPT